MAIGKRVRRPRIIEILPAVTEIMLSATGPEPGAPANELTTVQTGCRRAMLGRFRLKEGGSAVRQAKEPSRA